ncbi:sulfatase-like hydrolase/transferase [Akkermansiaceae bacterium]|nr:sulfatase-like hydrolase/transferase [Akkermansiaceae bacterium]
MKLLFPILSLLAPTAWAEKPNIVIFLADDAGWGDYSHSGNTQLSTPHIDSIAKEGASLENFFVCPLCAPTRAEFLTGRYYPRTGVSGVSTGHERLNLDEKTIADAFKAAGYATGAFGKWHNGSQFPYHPCGRGFDEYFGHTSGHWGEYFDAPLEDNGRMVKTEGYIVDVCTDKAISFIERKKDGPFFCYIPFTTPHSPWAAPKGYWEKFKDMPITQTGTNAKRQNIDETRCAYAMMENQDWNVGRVLRKLDELKLSENTIVIYFSDNGPNGNRWTGGLKGTKGGTDEGSVKSVCYMRFPGKIRSGKSIMPIAGAIDLLPTLTGFAGIQRVGDKPLDGRDLTPLLTGAGVEWPERKIFSAWPQKVSVRTQAHRLDAQGNLFNMTTDPGQTTVLNKEEPQLAAELSQAALRWKEEVFQDRITTRGDLDARPIPIGHREFPITMLPARDGIPSGGIKRSGAAPNCSYFINWTSTEGKMTWPADVHTAGRYRVSIDYTCPPGDAGSTIRLSFKDASLTGKVEPAWDPPVKTDQDTVPRHPMESQMKDFKTLNLGEIILAAGDGDLILSAMEMPGKSVMEVRRVTLTLME